MPHVKDKDTGFTAFIPDDEWGKYDESDKARWEVRKSPEEEDKALFDAAFSSGSAKGEKASEPEKVASSSTKGK